jgi:hypothetical protein
MRHPHPHSPNRSNGANGRGFPFSDPKPKTPSSDNEPDYIGFSTPWTMPIKQNYLSDYRSRDSLRDMGIRGSTATTLGVSRCGKYVRVDGIPRNARIKIARLAFDVFQDEDGKFGAMCRQLLKDNVPFAQPAPAPSPLATASSS